MALYHYGSPAKSSVPVGGCAIRTRLGSAAGEERDLWWRAEACGEVIEDVRDRLRMAGLPWLERFGSRDRILGAFEGLERSPWTNTPRIVSAVIRVARGETAAGRTLLTAQLSDATMTRPLHASYVRELALKLGLDPLDG